MVFLPEWLVEEDLKAGRLEVAGNTFPPKSAPRSEAAKPHQLRDAPRILLVRLHWHRLERHAQVARLDQLDRQTRLRQSRIKPLRQRACLKTYPLQGNTARQIYCAKPMSFGGYFLNVAAWAFISAASDASHAFIRCPTGYCSFGSM